MEPGVVTIKLLKQSAVLCVLIAGLGSCGDVSARYVGVPALLPLAGEIVTFAGDRVIPAASNRGEMSLSGASGLAMDSEGTLYIAVATQHAVFRLRAGSSVIEHFAGTGIGTFNGDGLPARETALHVPGQIAIEPGTEAIVIADTQNHRVRWIPRDGGLVSTLAGQGVSGVRDTVLPTLVPYDVNLNFASFGGDGGPVGEVSLNLPNGVLFDTSGNLIIADSANGRIRLVNRGLSTVTFGDVEIRPGSVETIAGDGSFGFGGDGGSALQAKMAYPKALAMAEDGDVLVIDSFNHRVRRVDSDTGSIETAFRAGNVERGQDAPAWSPPSFVGLATDRRGTVYVSHLNAHSIYQRPAGGTSFGLLAGVGVSGFSEDGELTPAAAIGAPGALGTTADGGVFFVESASGKIRRITGRSLETVAGGEQAKWTGPALSAEIVVPEPITVRPTGEVLFADMGRVEVGRVHGLEIHSLEGLDSRFGRVSALAFEDERGLLIADGASNRIWRARLSRDGSAAEGFEVVAGSGAYGADGDGGPAAEATLSGPAGLAVHPKNGDIYLSTFELPKIRRVLRSGRIETVAGTGVAGFQGDDGPAREAQFNWPMGLAFDNDANLYIADFFNHRVRKVDPQGRISTLAGTGERGYKGDGGPAAAAQLNNPTSVVADEQGNIYFADSNNHRVRKIEAAPPHLIRTVAGTGERGFVGDHGPATLAQLNVPRGVAIGLNGKVLYISDSLNGRLRAVNLEADGLPRGGPR